MAQAVVAGRVTQPSVARRLFTLALPVIGLNVLNVLALFVDTAMVGRLPNADDALTGLGFAVQLLFLLMVAMLGLTVGTVAQVARAHGAGHAGRVDHILHQSVQLTVLLGLSVAVIGNAVAPWLLEVLGAHGDAHAEAVRYLRPLLLGVVFNYLNILLAAVLRGVGNTKLAFLVALLMNAVNVVLNYGLILGNLGMPAMGVQGAAIGTVCAQALAVVVMAWSLRSGVIDGVFLRLRPAMLDLALARDFVRVGWPAALDMIVLNAGFLSIVGFLGAIDQHAVAAHGIGLRIQALAFVPGMSISQAAGAMVGNALGAGSVDEARRVVRAAGVLCFTVMSSLGLLIWGLDERLLWIFEVDPAGTIGQASLIWIAQLALCMPPVGLYLAFVGAFQGSGATRLSLGINAAATLAIQIPLSWVLAFPLGLGLLGAWAGFPISIFFKAALAWFFYQRGGWAKVGARA